MEVMCGRVCIPLAGAGVGGFVATNYSPFPSIGRDNIEVISVIPDVKIILLSRTKSPLEFFPIFSSKFLCHQNRVILISLGCDVG